MFEKEAEERVKDYIIKSRDCLMQPCKTLEDCKDKELEFDEVVKLVKDGAEFGYNKANEWQTGEPIKGREIFARNIANCNLLATYFSGAWRNAWNGAVIDFNKITMWRYTGFKNNGEEIVLPELKESK